jgi:hypothetical protein
MASGIGQSNTVRNACGKTHEQGSGRVGGLGVAVYHLGNNGTAREKLKAWTATSS